MLLSKVTSVKLEEGKKNIFLRDYLHIIGPTSVHEKQFKMLFLLCSKHTPRQKHNCTHSGATDRILKKTTVTYIKRLRAAMQHLRLHLIRTVAPAGNLQPTEV